MLCYYYPPVYGGYVERSAKFVKYLPACGWMPVVITKTVGGKKSSVGTERVIRVPDALAWLRRRIIPARIRDSEESKKRKEEEEVRTIPSLFAKLDRLMDTWLAIPDLSVGWAVLAFAPSWRALRSEEANVIYSTSPPASSHLLGLALKKVTNTPWVMDFRDPWTFESVSRHLRQPGLRLSFERCLERQCFVAADAIITNTPEMGKRYKALYPDCAHKIQTITNGFDAAEMSQAAAALERPSPWRGFDDGTFVVSHVGQFFREGREDQTPHALLSAIKCLWDERTLSPERHRIIFAGNLDPRVADRIRELGLEPLIDTPGVISHFDSLRLMLLSDLLLLFDPQGDGKTYVRSKLYEYLSSAKTILGVIPEGASHDLLMKSGRGLLASPNDVAEIAKSMRTAIERRRATFSNDAFDLIAYERRELTRELASLLEGLV